MITILIYLSSGACETILDFSNKYFLNAALIKEKQKTTRAMFCKITVNSRLMVISLLYK